MSLFPIVLESSSNILIAGAGGGFDFLCGLPIALELEAQGHTVHIANYSFTALTKVRGGKWHSEHLLEIHAGSFLEEGDYFPELLLAQWYQQRGESRPVWCFSQIGVRPTLACYNALIAKLGIDVVICVDGGIDGIFRGDEHDLATPSMDSISVIATSLCNAKSRIYACTAFGTEGAEGKVSHAQALHRMSDLIRDDAFLGVGAIRKNTPNGESFIQAVQSIFEQLTPVRRSIVVSTMLASMNGIYGRQSVHEKTHQSPPWISPLTSLIWYFEAEAVAKMKLFYKQILDSETVLDVATTIEKLREELPVQKHESIPI